jgi:EpsI family protein
LWFPLLFLFFAVPFGDALVPTMMDWTADFTVAALRASGVPVFREGNFFVIPSGNWSVVEACSGIKFLFSALMLGTLYAWVMYRSLGRRVAFVLVALTVPFIANWLRAYLTVLIAHLTDNRLMIGFEHLVFGWILFAAALLGLYWFGLRWREDDKAPPEAQPAACSDRNRLAVAALLGLVALAVWPPLAQALLQPVGDAGAPQISAPLAADGWAATAEPITHWTPSLTGAAATATFTYRKGSDRVGVFVAAFRHQHELAKLATTSNRFVANKGDPWIQTSQRTATVPPLSAVPSTVRAATLRYRSAGQRLVAWQWYWVSDAANSSDLRSKVELARARLLRRPDTGLWIAVFTPLGEGRDDGAADETLTDFLRSMDASLRAAFVGTTG